VGYVLQIWSAPTPQGYLYRQYGSSKRELVDFEGLALATSVNKSARKAKGDERKSQETG
jgi:hypothetical protein